MRLRWTSAAAPKVEDGWRTTYALLVCCATGPPAAAFMADLSTTSLVINGACVLVLGAIVVALQCFSMRDASNFYAMAVIVSPAVWNIYIGVLMPRSELAALVGRDIHTHDAVRLGYLLVGLMHHQTCSLMPQRQNLVLAMWALGIMLLGGGAISWRLDTMIPMRLPVFNVCIPFCVGYAIAQLAGRDGKAHDVGPLCATKLEAITCETGCPKGSKSSGAAPPPTPTSASGLAPPDSSLTPGFVAAFCADRRLPSE